jgi:hypothetical protein
MFDWPSLILTEAVCNGRACSPGAAVERGSQPAQSSMILPLSRLAQ